MDVILLTSGPDEGLVTPYRTIGAYKIAFYLRQAGYSVQVIDHVMFIDEDTLRTCIAKFITDKTLAIGVSTTFLGTATFPPRFSPIVVKILNELADQYPNAKQIFGGYYTRLALRSNLKQPFASIKSYGEDIFVDIVNWISGSGDEPHGVPMGGIKEYTASINPRYSIETDNFKFDTQDIILPNESLPLEVSRGCIFKCKFCNHLLLGRGKLDYLRDFELLKEELVYNYKTFGTTNYYIICDTFNDTLIKMQKWHEMVTNLPFKIKFTAYLRADLLDANPDVPYMLAEAGLFSCYHGIETLGEHASSVIGKGWSGRKAREYLPKLYHHIWKEQVFQSLSFICGLPGDTRESLLDTAKWFVEEDMYQISWHTLGLAPPGGYKHSSEFEQNANDYGYSFKNGSWQQDYWNQQQAKQYVGQVLDPYCEPYNARHGSWKILQLLQLGYQHSDFLKSSLANWTRQEQAQRGQEFVNQYVSRLLA